MHNRHTDALSTWFLKPRRKPPSPPPFTLLSTSSCHTAISPAFSTHTSACTSHNTVPQHRQYSQRLRRHSSVLHITLALYVQTDLFSLSQLFELRNLSTRTLFHPTRWSLPSALFLFSPEPDRGSSSPTIFMSYPVIPRLRRTENQYPSSTHLVWMPSAPSVADASSSATIPKYSSHRSHNSSATVSKRSLWRESIIFTHRLQH